MGVRLLPPIAKSANDLLLLQNSVIPSLFYFLRSLSTFLVTSRYFAEEVVTFSKLCNLEVKVFAHSAFVKQIKLAEATELLNLY